MPTIADVRQKYPQYSDMSDEQLADALYKKHYSDMPRDQFDTKIGMKAQGAAPSEAPKYDGGTFKALTEASHAGLMGGYDDEITAGMLAPVDAAIDYFKGDGFDMGRAYTRKQQMLDAQKGARREEHPVASTAGEIAGGIALGQGAAGAGVTLAGKAMPLVGRVGSAAVEGAGYGALYGSGEAKPGERLSGAGRGALIGGGVGLGAGAVGQMVASRAANKLAPPAPAVEDLASQSRALYDQAAQAGIVIKPAAVDKLAGNIQIMAGRLNRDLRPNTAGIVDDVMAMRGKPISLEELDELRQVVNQSMKRAQPQDVRTLERIKGVIDHFADNAPAGDIAGDIRGFGYIKDARQLWARKAKTEVIEDLMDAADVNTGQYTQSKMANTIRTKAAQLYRNKKQLNSFSDEEQALIRQMAKGGSNNQMLNWLAKLSPRGPVSTAAGLVGGQALLGPVGTVAVPAAGMLAGRAADRGAVAAANTLRDAAARGYIYQPPLLPNRGFSLIPGGVEASTATSR